MMMSAAPGRPPPQRPTGPSNNDAQFCAVTCAFMQSQRARSGERGDAIFSTRAASRLMIVEVRSRTIPSCRVETLELGRLGRRR